VRVSCVRRLLRALRVHCARSVLCAGMCMCCGCNKAVLSQHTDIIDETPIITSTKQTKQPRCYAKKPWVPYGDMCIKPPKYRDFLICTFLLFHNKTTHVHVTHHTCITHMLRRMSETARVSESSIKNFT